MNSDRGAAQRGAVVGVGLALIGVLALTGGANGSVDVHKTALPLRTSPDLTQLDAVDRPAAAAATSRGTARLTVPPPGGPAAAGRRLITSSDVLALVKKYFPADQVGNAMAVSRCESGHRNSVGATNSNGTTDWGVFQLNDGGTLQGALKRTGVSFSSIEEAQQLALNAEINIRAARNIFDRPRMAAVGLRVQGGGGRGPVQLGARAHVRQVRRTRHSPT